MERQTNKQTKAAELWQGGLGALRLGCAHSHGAAAAAAQPVCKEATLTGATAPRPRDAAHLCFVAFLLGGNLMRHLHTGRCGDSEGQAGSASPVDTAD